MSKLKIYTFPDTVLAQKAQPIARVEKALGALAEDMLETMYGAPGIGLAANQVGILQRIIVLDTDYDLEEDTVVLNKNPVVLINPEIVLREGQIFFEEGCLSVPEYYAEIKRAEKIKVQYTGTDGLSKTLSADGLLAIAIQHEIDHLDGKLFIDRLSPLKKEFVKKQLRTQRKENDLLTLNELAIKHSKPRKKGI